MLTIRHWTVFQFNFEEMKYNEEHSQAAPFSMSYDKSFIKIKLNNQQFQKGKIA